MLISIASGKGGTGKTTVALNMASVAEVPVQLMDCDVEEPNCHLFLAPVITERIPVTIDTPDIQLDRCTFCGRCSKACRFNAIAVFPGNAMVFPELCHGCSGCWLACPESAISVKARSVGTVEKGKAGHIDFVQGKLDVGVALSPPVIKAVRRELIQGGITIIDAPPGASCPMLAAVNGTDFCVLVTEPTPFGLHDLAIAVETLRKIRIPCGVVINRTGARYEALYDYLDKERVEILLEIPFDRKYAESYSHGDILVKAHPELKSGFAELLSGIMKRAAAGGR